MVPSPSSTSAVTPSVFPRRTHRPTGSRSSKSTDLQHQVAAPRTASRVAATRRCRPSIDESRSSRDDPPRLAVDVLAARPADVETPRRDAAARAGLDEDLDDQPVAVAGQRALQRGRSRSLTTTRVMPCGTIASKNSSAWSRSAVGESSSIHRSRSIVEIEVSTAWRNAWMDRSSASSGRAVPVPRMRASDEEPRRQEPCKHSRSGSQVVRVSHGCQSDACRRPPDDLVIRLRRDENST